MKCQLCICIYSLLGWKDTRTLQIDSTEELLLYITIQGEGNDQVDRLAFVMVMLQTDQSPLFILLQRMNSVVIMSVMK